MSVIPSLGGPYEKESLREKRPPKKAFPLEKLKETSPRDSPRDLAYYLLFLDKGKSFDTVAGLECLVENGFDLDLRTEETHAPFSRTLLQTALILKERCAAQALLDLGASPRAVDPAEWSFAEGEWKEIKWAVDAVRDDRRFLPVLDALLYRADSDELRGRAANILGEAAKDSLHNKPALSEALYERGARIDVEHIKKADRLCRHGEETPMRVLTRFVGSFPKGLLNPESARVVREERRKRREEECGDGVNRKAAGKMPHQVGRSGVGAERTENTFKKIWADPLC